MKRFIIQGTSGGLDPLISEDYINVYIIIMYHLSYGSQNRGLVHIFQCGQATVDIMKSYMIDQTMKVNSI